MDKVYEQQGQQTSTVQSQSTGRNVKVHVDNRPKATQLQYKKDSAQNTVTQYKSSFYLQDNRTLNPPARSMPGLIDNRHQTAQMRKLLQTDNNPAYPYQMKTNRYLQDNRPGQGGVIQAKSNNTGLPDNLKTGIETLSGHSMDDVKVHYNSAKPAQLQAHAYAQGTDIHLGPGQEGHLPHEAWHVVQQKQGRVKPTLQMKRGIAVNDDTQLEHEADVMGAKANNVGEQGNIDPVQAANKQKNPRVTSSASAVNATVQAKFWELKTDGSMKWHNGDPAPDLYTVIPHSSSAGPPLTDDAAGMFPVYRDTRIIETAGLELELKGANTRKSATADFATHEKVIDKGKWWIEVDSNNPELVTEPTRSKSTLFDWLRAGGAYLQRFQVLANIHREYEAIDESDVAARELKKQEYVQKRTQLGLPKTAQVTHTATPNLAKPQITFGIKKPDLAKFAAHVMGAKITHAEAYTKTGVKYENTQWPRINSEVAALYRSSPVWQNAKGQQFMTRFLAAPPDVQGLCMITIITVLFAMRKQDPLDEWQYYKARFSVMPRVPLSDVFDSLSGESKDLYRQIINLWRDAVNSYNATKDPDDETRHPDKIQDSSKTRSYTFETAVQSIHDSANRYEKTLKHKTKQVDAISSDASASTSNVGASVGALDLPGGSSGVFEIRTIPYTMINDLAKVQRLYEEIIDAYGGMA